jgi:hypothetical protein
MFKTNDAPWGKAAAPKAITDVLNRFSKEITESKRARKMPRCIDVVLSK